MFTKIVYFLMQISKKKPAENRFISASDNEIKKKIELSMTNSILVKRKPLKCNGQKQCFVKQQCFFFLH